MKDKSPIHIPAIGQTRLTRQEYLDQRCTHRQYYAQFVDASVKRMVLARFSLATLLAAKDEHLNDIPLIQWDGLAGGTRNQFEAAKLREVGDGPSLCSAVCILKEAARQIIEENRSYTP